MRINGNLNKFEMLQNYYLDVKGMQITYAEALRLFNQLDYDTERDFIEYYAEEIGYTITYKKDSAGNLILDSNGNPIFESAPPFVSFSGFNLDFDVDLIEETDENGKKIFVSQSLNRAKKGYEMISNSIEAYAVKNGIVLDPVWSQYSAEEIISMENEGVVIPQEIIDIAHTILESDAANFEGGEDGQDETTEKEPFLKLIPKAKKHIEQCEEKEEQIDKKINDLMEENKQTQRSLISKFEQQRASLEEYEEKIREWRSLQDKVNNGETLTDREARRYAEITGMLQDKNNNDADFKMDKNKIALSLTDINILAALGNQLAEETIEIGDTLADYTSKSNYKSTKKEATGEIGFLRAIIALIHGKALAKEANKVGNDTKEYTDETKDAVNDIAGILGIENLIANPESGDSTENEKSGEVKTAESEEADKNKPSDDEKVSQNEDENQQAQSAEHENDTKEEDFIINDKNVLELVKEAGEINADLIKEIKQSLEHIAIAVDDEKYAKHASKIIDKIVKEYQEEEARRQEEIKTKQDENKDAQKRIDELEGTEGKKEAEKYGIEVKEDNNDSEDQKEIDEKKALIEQNNQFIETKQQESLEAQEIFKQRISTPKSRIEKQIPTEMEALENDIEYKDKIIPEDKARLDFTDNTGETLRKMGRYRVIVGMEQIATRILIRKGLINVAKGTISMGIGVAARLAANIPSPKVAEKLTEKSTNNEQSAINELDNVDVKISEVTGEQTELEKYNESKNSEESEETENTEETQAEDSEVTEDSSDETAISVIQDKSQNNSMNAENNSGLNLESGEIVEPKMEPEEEQPAEDISTEETETEDKSAEETGETDTSDNSDSSDSDDNSNPSDHSTSGGSAKKKEDTAADVFSGGVLRSGKSDSKAAEQVKKDTEKDEKQLLKETQNIQRQMKRDEKQIIKMTKESLKAAKKQEEILTRYEELITENEEIAAQEEAKQMSGPSMITQQMSQGAGAGMAQPQVMDSSKGTSAENQAILQANDQEISVLGSQFDMHGKKIKRNRNRIIKLQKTTKKSVKTFNKKTNIRINKIKESEKKEADRQKKLAKQLGVVGIGENIASITVSVGSILALYPATATVGAAMVKWGTWALLLCGVTKAAINLANGNTTAALIGLGQTAITAVASISGTGGAAQGVLGQVSAGLSVVSSSAELVNNVKTVQGKEASGSMSKISTIAGVASAVTSAASSFTNFEDANKVVHNSFKDANGLGKMSIIGNVVGALTTGASQIMSEFNIGDKKTADLLGSIGGAVNMAASIGKLTAGKKKELDNKNNDTQQTQDDDQSNGTDKSTEKKTDTDKSGESKDGTKNDDSSESKTETEQKKPTQQSEEDKKKTEQTKSDTKTDAKKAENNFTTVVNGNASSADVADAAVQATSAISDNNSEMQTTVQEGQTTSQETQATTEANAEVEQTKEAKKQAKAEQKEKAKQEKVQKKADKKQEIEKAKEAKKQKEMEAERVEKSDEAAINNIVENGASEEFAGMDDNKLDDMIEGAIEAGDTKKQEMLEAEKTRRQEYVKQQAEGGPEAEQSKNNQKELAKNTKKNLNTKAKVKNVKENGASEDFAKYDDAQMDELAKSEDAVIASDAKKEIEERKEYKKQMEMLEANKDKKENAFEIVSKTAELGTNVMKLFADNEQDTNQKKKVASSGIELLEGYDFENHSIGDKKHRRRIKALAGRYMA